MSLVSPPLGWRSPPSTRNHSTTHYDKPRLQWRTGFLAVFLASLVSTAAAIPPDPALPAETLILDTRIPVQVDGIWTMVSQDAELKVKRGLLEDRDDSTATATPETTTVEIAVSSVTKATSTSVAPTSPLPSPLDGGLSSNFTNIACPAFIQSFLTNPTFKQCYPFSVLLQGSTSFFAAEKSLVSITRVLDASCSANSTLCTSYLTSLARNLTSSDHCGDDYNQGNPLVVQNYAALLSYQTVYAATCLKDPAPGSAYCFANAVTNLTSPSNVYFYYLPLNISLPGSSVPGCSWCLENTMAVFQSAAANRALPIASTYVAAAQQVNAICGPGFANATLPNAVVVKDSGSSGRVPPWSPSVLLALLPLLAAVQALL